MTELYIWLAAFVLIALMFGIVGYEAKRRQTRTAEDWEKEATQRGTPQLGRALLRAGAFELEKAMKPNSRAAQNFLEDKKRGMTDSRKSVGEKD